MSRAGVELVTVCVCTLGARERTQQLIGQLVRQLQSDDQLLVVLSGAHARAPTGLSESCLVRCGRLGLSGARNQALSLAKHDVIAFLDDDVEVAGDYVGALRFAFREPVVGYVGGRITVPLVVAEWVRASDLAWTFSSFDLGDRPRWLARGETVVGANMALRRRALAGGFDERLGYVGGKQIGGEEVELVGRLVSAGWEGWYEPGMSVIHHVGVERNSLRWQAARGFWEGVSLARRGASGSPKGHAPAKRAVALAASGELRGALVYGAQELGLLWDRGREYGHGHES